MHFHKKNVTEFIRHWEDTAQAKAYTLEPRQRKLLGVSIHAQSRVADENSIFI